MAILCKRGSEIGRKRQKPCRVCKQNAQNGDLMQTRQSSICLILSIFFAPVIILSCQFVDFM